MDIFNDATLMVAEHLPLLLIGSLKALVVLVITAILALVLRGRGAALRHWVWSLGLAGALLMPALTVALPAWNITVAPLPAPTELQTVEAEQYEGPEASPVLSEMPTAATPSGQSEAIPGTAGSDTRSAEELDEAAVAASPTDSGTASNQQERAGMGWPVWVLAVWLGGALLVALYFVAGSVFARWLTRGGRTVDDPVWTGLLRDTCRELGIERTVRLVWSDRAAMPFTWGITRPVIVLPAAAAAWTMERRHIVLLHEGAHIKRWDCLTQAVGQLACAIHWFNPLVWWGARQLRIERERATDDYVIAVGTRPSTYAEHLLELARSLGTTPGTPFGAVSMAKPSQLEGRLLSILRTNGERTTLNRIGATATGVLFVALLLPLAAMQPVPSEADRTFVHADEQTIAVPSEAERAEPDVNADHSPAEEVVAPSTTGSDTPIEHTFRVQEGGLLTLDTNRGSISLQTGSTDRVHVEVHISGHDAAEVDWFDVDFEQRDNDVFVTGEAENRGAFSWLRGRSSASIRYVVTVPPRYNVDLNTAGGSIEVGDLEGSVAVHTSGGSLHIGQIDGPIDAQTSGGSIQVEGSTADARVRTSGGSITLGPVRGEVDAHTSGGSIRVNGVAGAVNARTSGGSVTARITEQPQGDSELRTSGGSVTIYIADGIGLDLHAQTSVGRVVADIPVEVEGERSRSELRGTIGGGGPLLAARTSAGNVNIRPLNASADADPYRDSYHYEESHEKWAHDLSLEIEQAIEEAMAELELEMESMTAEIEREIEHAMAGIDVRPVVNVAHETASTALIEVLRELDREIPEGWAKQGIASAAAGLLEKKAYEQSTLTITQNGETEEVPIVTLLAELPGQAGYPALSRLAENHPDPDVRRQAEEARNQMR